VQLRAARRALIGAGSSRAGRCIGLAALALLLGNESLQNAVAEGDTRTISLHHMHTGEDLTITYKRDGRYDEDALKQLNHILRDWRRDEEIKMDPRLLDVVWEVYREVDAKVPIQVVCGYRSPATNAMLRRRSRGVAQFSQHMLGRAMDFYIPGIPLETQREAGLRLQRGGVGYYPSSGSPFIHLDVGSVRHWPRMSPDQLARVLARGRTVRVASDSHPSPGTAVALADIDKRGSSVASRTSLEAARTAGVKGAARPQRNLNGSLFTSKDEDEDSETAAAAPSSQPTAAVEKKAEKVAEAKPVPPPTTRPTPRIAAASAATFNLASAESQPARLATPPARATNTEAPSSANELFSNRGYWEPAAAEAPAPKEPVQLASTSSRTAPAPRARAEQRLAAGETTGAVAPWPVRTADAADRVPNELALAYAAQANVEPPSAPVTRSLSAGPALPRSAATIEQSGTTTIAKKNVPAAPAAVRTTTPELKAGAPLEDPWLRALLLAPDLQNFMTATLLGDPTDLRQLQPLMEKPDAVVMMTFCDDPHLGMTTERFSGSAVVFVSTMTFAKRTAALQ
jgi:uncharacterized protein YcbK (DUF882 family)